MGIVKEGYFWIKRDSEFISGGIESSQLNECVEFIKKERFDGVFGNEVFGFYEDNLEFLHDLPFLKQVWFWECNFTSIEGLYALRDLEYCGVNNKHGGIDYSHFPKLHTVVTHWNKKDKGLDHSAIKKLHLWHYKPQHKSFDNLDLPDDLENLELNWVNPANLEGLKVQPKLKSLEIHYARSLVSLSNLPNFAPNLKKIVISNANKMNDFSSILNHPSIDFAVINDKFIERYDGSKMDVDI